MKYRKVTGLLAFCCLVYGCTSMQKPHSPDFSKITMPEVEFKDALLADVLDFLIGYMADTDPKVPYRPSIIVDWAKAEKEAAAHDKKLHKLRDYCGGKTITLQIKECTVLDLLDFISRLAEVDYELTGCRLILKSKSGEVLAPL